MSDCLGAIRNRRAIFRIDDAHFLAASTQTCTHATTCPLSHSAESINQRAISTLRALPKNNNRSNSRWMRIIESGYFLPVTSGAHRGSLTAS